MDISGYLDKKQNRDYAISFIRVLAMTLILCYHFFQYYGIRTHLNVGVYIFLCMSGYLYGRKKIDNWLQFYFKNFIKILLDMYIVLTIFLIVAYLDTDYSLTLENVLKQFLLIDGKAIGGVCHLWFITYILGCYILIPVFSSLIDRIADEQLASQLLAIVVIMAMIVICGIGRFNSACINSFFAGLFWAKIEKKGNIVVYKRILYTIAILSVLIQLFCDFNIGLLEGGVENDIYIFINVYVLGIAGCALFFSLKDLGEHVLKKPAGSKILERSGILTLDRLSYDIYLIHFPLILSKSCCLMNLINNDLLSVLLVIIVTLILALIVNNCTRIIKKGFFYDQQ